MAWCRRCGCLTGSEQVQGAYFDFAGQWTRSHTFKGSTDVVPDAVLRDFKSFVYKRQKEVGGGGHSNVNKLSEFYYIQRWQ